VRGVVVVLGLDPLLDVFELVDDAAAELERLGAPLPTWRL
jgi:hypothetical protein